MSRLIDKVLITCKPFKVSSIFSREELKRDFLNLAKNKAGDKAEEKELEAIANKYLVDFLNNEAVSKKEYNFQDQGL